MESYVMVGAPGAGKSTYAEKLAKTEDAVIISGDNVRAELYGDADAQGSWVEIWDRIEELVSESCGKIVILDGTYHRTDYRQEAITLLKSYGYDKIEAVVVNPGLETCIMRNARRHRGVPRHVIINMHEQLEQSLENIYAEDFDRLNFVL